METDRTGDETGEAEEGASGSSSDGGSNTAPSVWFSVAVRGGGTLKGPPRSASAPATAAAEEKQQAQTPAAVSVEIDLLNSTTGAFPYNP